jgi:protein-disulfide isomerase
MTQEQNKEEGKQEENIVSVTAQEVSGDNKKGGNGKTVEEIDKNKMQAKKIKNLTAAVIILAGVAVGSFFVDIAQFISRSGYSEGALKSAEIFQSGDKTWVAYKEPVVEVKVLTVSDEELENCENCDPTEVLVWMKKFVPTLVAKKVDASSDEGKALIEKYQLKAIPSFVFDDKVKDTDFYKQGQASMIFEEKDGNFVLNSSALGLPVGKYLAMPEIDKETDVVLGAKDGKTEVIVYSDFQCPYSKIFYDVFVPVAEEYKDDVSFTFKDMPLSFHAQAVNAAMAARCAQEQGEYWEMAQELFDNQEAWGETEGKEIFKTYAQKIGLNMTEFNACLDNDKYADKIAKDMEEAGSFGISGTPSGFVGEQFIGGVVKKDDLKKMIEEEISKNQ